MIDITSIVEAAYSQRMTWTKDTFLEALKAIQTKCSQSISDWDDGPPENWGAVQYEGNQYENGAEIIAIICRIFPLAIYLAKKEETIKPILENFRMIGLPMNGWNDVEFQIQWSTMRKCFDLTYEPEDRPGGEIDVAGFSVGDLWWETITA